MVRAHDCGLNRRASAPLVGRALFARTSFAWIETPILRTPIAIPAPTHRDRVRRKRQRKLSRKLPAGAHRVRRRVRPERPAGRQRHRQLEAGLGRIGVQRLRRRIPSRLRFRPRHRCRSSPACRMARRS